LDGRLILDDPDELDALSVVAERRHGTEMASLILHGADCEPHLLPVGQPPNLRGWQVYKDTLISNFRDRGPVDDCPGSFRYSGLEASGCLALAVRARETPELDLRAD
jgi:hypothetical protein